MQLSCNNGTLACPSQMKLMQIGFLRVLVETDLID